MCKFIGKSNEGILCKLSKNDILRLYSVGHVSMETTKTSHFTCPSKLSSVYFSLAKFQIVSCNRSLAMIWQKTYTQKLPKQCSATLIRTLRRHAMVSVTCGWQQGSFLHEHARPLTCQRARDQ